jgi:gamma-glutamyl-gamma-aminobutyrate hydrolase PuuD
MKTLILSVSLFALNLYAAPVTVCLWQPFGDGMRLVVPTNLEKKNLNDTDFCKAGVQKYVDAVNADQDLRSMMGGRTLPIPTNSRYSVMTAKFSALTERPRMIIMANEFNQMSEAGEFVMSTMMRQFWDAGADPYALPVAADISIGTQASEFRNSIAGSFDLMLALGGEDIDPALYKQEVTNAIPADIHKTRDSHEKEFHKAYVALGKGVFYGICRGHQMAAVVQGQKLYQDIYVADKYTPTGHTTTPHGHGAWHEITVSEDSIFTKWAITEMKNGKRTMWVNSFHHEAVAFPLAKVPGAKSLTVTGFEQDDPAKGDSHKIVEIIESADKKYISMQFHPEGMDEDMHGNGKKIREGMVKHAASMRRR